MIGMLNALDVSKVDPSDGLDAGEETNIDDQIKQLTKNDPDIADGGRCQAEFDALPSDQQTANLARIRPEIVRVLIGVGANATSKFSTVASSIN